MGWCDGHHETRSGAGARIPHSHHAPVRMEHMPADRLGRIGAQPRHDGRERHRGRRVEIAVPALVVDETARVKLFESGAAEEMKTGRRARGQTVGRDPGALIRWAMALVIEMTPPIAPAKRSACRADRSHRRRSW